MSDMPRRDTDESPNVEAAQVELTLLLGLMDGL